MRINTHIRLSVYAFGIYKKSIRKNRRFFQEGIGGPKGKKVKKENATSGGLRGKEGKEGIRVATGGGLYGQI